MTTATTIERHAPSRAKGGVVLYAVAWSDYERIGRIFRDRPIRLTYDRGTLEIMTISFRHERRKAWLRKMIDALAEETRIDIASGGSTTFKRKAKQKGLEPDECFWIQHESDVRGRDEITLENAPPPDLVLEVEVSRSVLSRIGIYASFAVPEVWRCRQKAIRVVRLVEGKYQVAERSAAFPFLNPTALLPFLNLPPDVSEVEMIRRFRDWVRQQQSSGWPAGGV